MKILRITPRLVLRELRLDDADDIFRSIDTQREYLGRWLPFVENTRTAGDSHAFVESAILGAEPVFTLRLDDTFIGLAGFKDTAADNSHTEIGYWMNERHQGRGYMTAAVREMIRFAFEEMSIGIDDPEKSNNGNDEIFIKCAVGNHRSRAIPHRLGFAFRYIEPGGEYVSEGVFRDVEVYSLKR